MIEDEVEIRFMKLGEPHDYVLDDSSLLGSAVRWTGLS